MEGGVLVWVGGSQMFIKKKSKTSQTVNINIASKYYCVCGGHADMFSIYTYIEIYIYIYMRIHKANYIEIPILCTFIDDTVHTI